VQAAVESCSTSVGVESPSRQQQQQQQQQQEQQERVEQPATASSSSSAAAGAADQPRPSSQQQQPQQQAATDAAPPAAQEADKPEVPAARRVAVDQRQKWQRISDWVTKDSAAATAATTGTAPTATNIPSAEGSRAASGSSPEAVEGAVVGSAAAEQLLAGGNSGGVGDGGDGDGNGGAQSLPHSQQQDRLIAQLRARLAAAEADARRRVAAAEAGARESDAATRRLLEAAKQVLFFVWCLAVSRFGGGCSFGAAPCVYSVSC